MLHLLGKHTPVHLQIELIHVIHAEVELLRALRLLGHTWYTPRTQAHCLGGGLTVRISCSECDRDQPDCCQRWVCPSLEWHSRLRSFPRFAKLNSDASRYGVSHCLQQSVGCHCYAAQLELHCRAFVNDSALLQSVRVCPAHPRYVRDQIRRGWIAALTTL